MAKKKLKPLTLPQIMELENCSQINITLKSYAASLWIVAQEWEISDDEICTLLSMTMESIARGCTLMKGRN